MARKEFFNNITSVINDWKNTSFTFNPQKNVPGLDDKNLTYGNGEEKKGVEIETCVLFVDIRNSVQLTKEKHTKLLPVVAMSSLDAWPRRARSMKTGSVASLVMVIPTRNWRYSPRL